jgi:hypothetical protein
MNKKDIEILDFIIDKCIETRAAITAQHLIDAKYLSLFDKKGYTSFTAKLDVTREFIRYLSIINKEGVCKCSFEEDCEYARSNSETLDFQRQGGFKKLYEKRSEKIKRDEKRNDLELKNLELQKENFEYHKSIRNKEEQIRNLTRDNLRLGNWDIRFRWLIAIITFLIGFVVKYFIDK